jgi:hypothetical protein
MKLQKVEMVHPNLPGQKACVPKQAVPHHQRAGWKLAAETTPPDTPADPPQDPPRTEEPTTEAPADAGASALPDESTKRRRTRGDE